MRIEPGWQWFVTTNYELVMLGSDKVISDLERDDGQMTLALLMINMDQ